ncbi:hypothetical protein EI94DRAFT_1581406, partial [Lactarius quietus]
FPVRRVDRFLKQCTQTNICIGANAAVYAVAILEYLAAEVLKLAGAWHAPLFLLNTHFRWLWQIFNGDDDHVIVTTTIAITTT